MRYFELILLADTFCRAHTPRCCATGMTCRRPGSWFSAFASREGSQESTESRSNLSRHKNVIQVNDMPATRAAQARHKHKHDRHKRLKVGRQGGDQPSMYLHLLPAAASCQSVRTMQVGWAVAWLAWPRLAALAKMAHGCNCSISILFVATLCTRPLFARRSSSFCSNPFRACSRVYFVPCPPVLQHTSCFRRFS